MLNENQESRVGKEKGLCSQGAEAY